MIFVLALAFSSVTHAERVDHRAAGIAFDAPDGWYAADLQQVQANRENLRLSDPELQQAIATRSALPLFVFTKYEEPHAGLNPTVQVTLRAGLAGTPADLLNAALEPMRRGFDGFRVVSPVRKTMVGGWPAASVRVSYTLVNRANDSVHVLSRLWLVPRGGLMFLIGMSGTQEGGDVCEQEFVEVLTSIVIDR